jgi:anaerobic selenocysteine-containing dehydrogenase
VTVRAALNVKPSICRICVGACPILVEVVDEQVTKVKGDPSNDVYHGYTCEKGRNQPEAYKDPNRLLRSLKRMPNGTFQAIPVELALDEIADKVQAIVEEHGPSAYAHYQGTQRLVHPAIVPMMNAVLAAMKSPWGFTASTLDQPGKPVSQGLHGFWGAPHHGFEDADVGLIIGANPLVSLCPGLPQTGPKRWLRNARARGYRLIVIDPRRTETAAQSDLFLQTRPGHDAAIVAGLINIILQNGLEDKSFIDSDVMGFDALRSAVEAFNPDEVERRPGIPAADLIEAARVFATFHLEMIGMHAPGCGVAPWAHVTQPVVEPPSGSEVIEDWEFFYGLAQRLGLQLGLRPYGAGAHVDPVPLDMGVKPTSDDLLDILARDGRVPLAEVSSHLHGKNYDSIKEYVLPKDEGCTERLDVGAPSMLLELASIEVDAGAGNSTWAGEKFPFRMVCRRLNSRYNSTGHTFPSLIKSNPYNAAYMHPDDLDALGVVAGDEVVIANPMASVRALVEPDDTLRRGLVSIAHCWGSGVPGDDDPRSGAAISRLISVGDAFDPLTGQPIMSNVLVSVRPVARLSTDRL